MQVFAHFGPARIENIGSKLFRDLSRICPSNSEVESFWEVRLAIDDPKVDLITKCLRKHGLMPDKPFFEFRKGDKIVSFHCERIYTMDELDRFEYLLPEPLDSIHYEGRDDNGVGYIETDEFVPERPIPEIAGFDDRGMCVTERLMHKMVSYGLTGIRYDPLEYKEYRRVGDKMQRVKVDWPEASGPYLELSSDHLMPPLSKSNTLIHEDKTPFSGDFSLGCIHIEGNFTPSEFHYDTFSVRDLKKYDLRRTYEMFSFVAGTPLERDRRLVVSQRFRQFCVAENLPMGWLPVHVDPD